MFLPRLAIHTATGKAGRVYSIGLLIRDMVWIGLGLGLRSGLRLGLGTGFDLSLRLETAGTASLYGPGCRYCIQDISNMAITKPNLGRYTPGSPFLIVFP